ncbi:Eukaryotic translation initiation factor 3 subunit B [Vanrija pseudolonga]|uniref:Eukaryotic translation initiation factor 3 subunit B n=1 Tax=Vanrija pseudolonga TaxID=143232 RepID=A0AAF0Y8U9_9TREE|nr:Eukaryotic translation initiation factor 3 subunit B [Vanrija pseudolonga]
MAIDLSEFDAATRAQIQAELDAGYAEIEAKHAVVTSANVDHVVVVDGLPVVDSSKRDRLLLQFSKLLAKFGAGVDDSRITMPWDEKRGTNKGGAAAFVFVAYADGKEAEHAIRVLNGVKFGSKNTLAVNHFADIERYARAPIGESDLPPGWKDKAFVPREYTRNWLSDKDGRDQYLAYRDNAVALWWHGRGGKAESVKNATSGFPIGDPITLRGHKSVHWSPEGTHLVSVHEGGVALWSGARFDARQLFAHPHVVAFRFSPGEKYLVTYSHLPISVANHENESVTATFGAEDDGAVAAVWDVKSSRLLRTFGPDEEKRVPVFKWSFDDAFIARLVPGAIQVYELPGMGLLEKKSVRIDAVRDFEWCPGKDTSLAYWTAEGPNTPARVGLMAMPSRKILRTKNLINVTDVKFYFQNQGDYLCIKVDRHARKAKQKRATFCSLEVFRLREKNYPVESIEHKEYVSSVDWEPAGTRFVIRSAPDAAAAAHPHAAPKFNVSFIAPDPKKNIFTAYKVLEGKTTSTVSWAPRERHLVLASLGAGAKFDLEFWDADYSADDKERTAAPRLLATAEHYGMTELAWDPSGRYMATSASVWAASPEPGFNIWDFRGQQLLHASQDKFKAFAWRPRPASLLSSAERGRIARSLKAYSQAFDEEDAAEENRGRGEKLAERQRAVVEWDAWRRKNNARISLARRARGKEKSVRVVKFEEERIDEWVEELVDEVEEVVLL